MRYYVIWPGIPDDKRAPWIGAEFFRKWEAEEHTSNIGGRLVSQAELNSSASGRDMLAAWQAGDDSLAMHDLGRDLVRSASDAVASAATILAAAQDITVMDGDVYCDTAVRVWDLVKEAQDVIRAIDEPVPVWTTG